MGFVELIEQYWIALASYVLRHDDILIAHVLAQILSDELTLGDQNMKQTSLVSACVSRILYSKPLT